MRAKKILYICFGCLGVVLGLIGAALPIVPSFPFLFLAAFCFTRGSEKLHNWLIGTRLYRYNLKNYFDGKGMTWKTKFRLLGGITLLLAVSFIMTHKILAAKIAVGIVWILYVIYFVFFVKTMKDSSARVKTVK